MRVGVNERSSFRVRFRPNEPAPERETDQELEGMTEREPEQASKSECQSERRMANKRESEQANESQG